MATGAGLLKRARPHIGEEYVNTRVPKDDPNWKGPWDCAEFMSWLVYQEAGILYGCVDNKAKPSQADAYTGAWKNDSQKLGIRISVDEAASTVGAMLLRYPPAPGKMGHIALSDGTGGTVEAMSRSKGVCAGTVQGRRWDTGLLVPDIDYGRTTETVTVTGPAELYAVNMPNMNKSVVTAIQKALAAKGFDPGKIDGDFGKKTALAVAAFQESLGLVVDGEVGNDTASKLGITLPGTLAGGVLGALPGILTTLPGSPTGLPGILTAGLSGVPGGSAMGPLIAIAASVLPEIIKAVAGDKAGTVASSVSQAVTEVTKTSNPEEAKAKLSTDPAAVTELQVKLVEIAAAQEEKRQAAQLEMLKAQHAEEEKRREARFKEMQEDAKDRQDARSRFVSLALANNPMAWATIAVSLTVLIGFFAILLILLIFGMPQQAANRTEVLQIINIAIGALAAAFATVVSFWLGSSQGSRNKDAATMQFQADQAKQTAEVLKTQARQAEAVIESKQPPVIQKAEAEAAKANNFRKCVDVVLRHEGGFSDHPHDPGGATNLGITLNTLKEWRGDNSLTADDVRNLTVDEAREIYRTRYWNVLRCDDLPAGVDLVVFDFGVNAGPSRSAKVLQKVVGAEADGSVGPATLAATKAQSSRDVVTQMSQLRLEFYRGLSTWPTFGRGWTNRTNAVQEAALEMVSNGS